MIEWVSIMRNEPIACQMADRHYSRQTIGGDAFLPPGQWVAFLHKDEKGYALWAVVHNIFKGKYRWRNTIFRNESNVLSSELIMSATEETYHEWIDTYGKLPDLPLTSEIDVEATNKRRGQKNKAGHCYLMAGWTHEKILEGGRGGIKVLMHAPVMSRT